MSEQYYVPMETNPSLDKIQSTIKEVLMIDDFPDDKKVEISMDFMVVPKTMIIKISKK